MIKKFNTIKSLIDNGVVAVIRAKDQEDARNIVSSCIDGGLLSIELAFTTPNADKVIYELKKEFKDKINLGAGTVLDDVSARIAILAGADYIVSPSFDRETAKLCNRYSIPYLAGCMSIKEIIKAMESGVDIVKLFPGNDFDPSFIKAVKAPLPNANIMPTGGVDLKNLKTWFEAGAVAVGIGGDLVKEVRGKDYSSVKIKAEQYIKEFKTIGDKK